MSTRRINSNPKRSRDALQAPWRDYPDNFTFSFLLLNNGVYLSIQKLKEPKGVPKLSNGRRSRCLKVLQHCFREHSNKQTVVTMTTALRKPKLTSGI